MKDKPFNFQGAVSPERNGASNIAMIGADSNGIIAILIGLLIPSNPLSGSYALYASFSDVFTEFSTNLSTSFDAGTFSVK